MEVFNLFTFASYEASRLPQEVTVPEPRMNKQVGKQRAKSESAARCEWKGVVSFLEGLN